MKLPPEIPLYGTPIKGKCNSEATEQKDFFGRLKLHYPDLYRIAIHPKNEGQRNGAQQTYDAQSGAMNKGASDIVIPGCPAFVCELKKRNNAGGFSPGQVEYLQTCQAMGAFACGALGADGVMLALEDWLVKYYPDIQK